MVDNHIMRGPKLLTKFCGDLFEDWALKGRERATGKVDPVHAMAAPHSFVWAQSDESTVCKRTG